ncbi:MAG: hypothetical protein LW720_10300 [Pirellula sp.]|nr:hypothetical protein [Pirellula sp.]
MSSKNLERWFPRLQGPIESIFEQWVPMASQRVSERLGRRVEFSLQGTSIEGCWSFGTGQRLGFRVTNRVSNPLRVPA